MNKALSQRINIFLSVDKSKVNEYFNPHDPAPIYKRQLRFDFVQYLNESVANYRRHSIICYKLKYKLEDYAVLEPFMYAIRQHFLKKEELKRREFAHFKRSSYKLLLLSVVMVMFCEGLLPYIFFKDGGLHAALSNCLDVFSWVILWRPIHRLVFEWTPYLKEISMLHKLANAEVIEIEADTDELLAPLKISELVRA